jgi:hypothetical protein
VEKSSALYVGMDVHQDSIDIAAAESARDAEASPSSSIKMMAGSSGCRAPARSAAALAEPVRRPSVVLRHR